MNTETDALILAQCPKCKSKETRRVNRGSLLKNLLPFLPAKRFKCYSCYTKFYKWG